MLKHHITKYLINVMNIIKYKVKLMILRNGNMKMINFLIKLKNGIFLLLNIEIE